MLELLKQKIFQSFKPEDIKGGFLSIFDEKGNLILSSGVLQTDKPLSELLETLYHGLVEKYKNTKILICDIITEVSPETDITKLIGLSPKEYGIFVTTPDGTKSGVVLPATQGVADMKQALFLIKQKYQITGNITMTAFKTQRIALKN